MFGRKHLFMPGRKNLGPNACLNTLICFNTTLLNNEIFKMGILGLPNVGKSTFFNVLTKSEAQAENYPFCTIDPNESRVAVEDSRFDWLIEHFKPLSRVPAFLNVVDIAGLVKGSYRIYKIKTRFSYTIRCLRGTWSGQCFPFTCWCV